MPELVLTHSEALARCGGGMRKKPAVRGGAISKAYGYYIAGKPEEPG